MKSTFLLARKIFCVKFKRCWLSKKYKVKLLHGDTWLSITTTEEGLKSLIEQIIQNRKQLPNYTEFQ